MSASEFHIDVRSALKLGLAQLRDAHVPSFTLAAELLLLHVLGRDRTWLYAYPEEQISSADAERFSTLLARRAAGEPTQRSEEHTSELQSQSNLVCRLLLEKKKINIHNHSPCYSRSPCTDGTYIRPLRL